MTYFDEFKEIYRKMKADVKAVSKIRKPVKKTLREMPDIGELGPSCLAISRITGIDPYKVRDLLVSGDIENPILEQPLKDLFMGLLLVTDIEPSQTSRYAEQTRRSNKEIEDAYNIEIEKYNHASKVSQSLRTNKYRGPSRWFKEIVNSLIEKIQNNNSLSEEDITILSAIKDQTNHKVEINGEYQIDILRRIHFSTEDVIRIMRRSRDIALNQ